LFLCLGKDDSDDDSDAADDEDDDGIRAQLRLMGFSSDAIRNALAKSGILSLIFCASFSNLDLVEKA
jgi:hypothetical protein